MKLLKLEKSVNFGEAAGELELPLSLEQEGEGFDVVASDFFFFLLSALEGVVLDILGG